MSEKGLLNTTIDKCVLNDFREYCKTCNCPMNMVLEMFMRQFANGEFIFKLGKNKQELEFED